MPHVLFWSHCNLAISNIIPRMNVTTNPEGVIETPTGQNVSHLITDKHHNYKLCKIIIVWYAFAWFSGTICENQ